MKSIIVSVILTIFYFQNIFSQGNVYLVLGSDTGVWDGLGVSSFHNIYGLELYTDPNRNAYKVMADDFRNQIKDSYGNTLKMTWWMMGGNMYRYGVNTNVPAINILPLYLMKKYHDEKIQQWGDEVSFHYHTFKWYDYNGDGKYFWNQAQQFQDSQEDFDYTLAQFLLEENVFPVSFRSGWHYMNNYWQNYLDELLPFSMHDDYPNIHNDTEEPLDNIYDWSKSSSQFVPFHPSADNYQLEGNLNGWELRSIYMARMDSTLMNYIFNQAKSGTDQVVCIWAHLPEDNFLDNIKRINDIVHNVAENYSDVKFRYCSAIEAMQRWMKTTDTTKPNLTLNEQINGDEVKFLIQTNESIFQKQPFIAIKDIYENYSIEPCENVGGNTWITTKSFIRNKLAKVGAAVTDTSGNLSTAFINILPDDIFIDDKDAGYSEINGNWISKADRFVWDLNYRQTDIHFQDSAIVKWTPNINYTGNYNIFLQLPFSENQTKHIKFLIKSGNEKTEINSIDLNSEGWNFVSTAYFDSNKDNSIEMIAYGSDSVGNTITADVLKISALIKDKQLIIPQEIIEFGPIAEEDSASFNLILNNLGNSELKITGISTNGNEISFNASLPLIIPGMQNRAIEFKFHAENSGAYNDTVFIYSDDPNNSIYRIPYKAQVEPYFKLVDNGDTAFYKEIGIWNYSTANGYAGSSRYAYLKQNPPAYSVFTTKLKKSGIYNIEEIVPVTVNSAKQALYILSIDDIDVDSTFVDQNEGSGDWKIIGKSFLPANVKVALKIVDSGENTSNVVLRADAIKFSLEKEISQVENDNKKNIPFNFELSQNYPNPFNPSTIIRYSIPQSNKVLVEVFDILGRKVRTLVNKIQQQGSYQIHFNAANLSNGIYFYRITAGKFSATKKMILLK